MVGERYNESADTFSFSLVLLCLAAGDIGYMSKKGRMLSRIAYAQGWRPPLPSKLRERCPDLASLIKQMWNGNFRKRPALKDVVPRLEAASTAALDGVIELTVSTEEEDYCIQPGGGTFDADALRAENVALKAQIVKADARHRADRLEIAEFKAALLAGTTSIMEYDDDFGILGGMFICTSNTLSNSFVTSAPSQTQTHPAKSTESQLTPTRSAAFSARGPLARSMQ